MILVDVIKMKCLQEGKKRHNKIIILIKYILGIVYSIGSKIAKIILL